MLVIAELNFATVHREYEGVDGLHGAGAAEQVPTGHTLYVRAGAACLVAALLREPRCCLVMISSSGTRHCLPMAQLLLRRAVPGDWVVEEGQLPSVICPGQPRVYVIDRESATEQHPRGEETTEASWFVKDMLRVWDGLRACGCGEFGGDNTVILDNWRSNTSSPANVIEVPRWVANGRVEDEDEMEAIQMHVLDVIAALAASVPAALAASVPACPI